VAADQRRRSLWVVFRGRIEGVAVKTVLYDEQCGFCCVMADWVVRLHSGAPLRVLPIQSAGGQTALASVPAMERLASWHLLDERGRLFSGGDAFAPLLRDVPGARWLAPVLEWMPGVTGWVYRVVAGRRTTLARLIPRGYRRRARDRMAIRASASQPPPE
jgi:predicted DCC family thiol-disulfide oxidoreductase YuxK